MADEWKIQRDREGCQKPGCPLPTSKSYFAVLEWGVTEAKSKDGKSTGVDLVRMVLGEENCDHQSIDALTGRFGLADIRGKLLNIAEEDAGYGHKVEKCPEGVPVDQALFAIAAAAAASFGILFRAVTQATMGRKKRSQNTPVGTRTWLADMAWLGTGKILHKRDVS